MESNIKGLVAAGHEMASELKAECGAVDMRSVAKLSSDLATQLATLRADWHGFITHCLAQANCRTNLRKMLRPTLIANMHRLTKSLWSFTSGFGNKVKPSVPLALA